MSSQLPKLPYKQLPVGPGDEPMHKEIYNYIEQNVYNQVTKLRFNSLSPGARIRILEAHTISLLAFLVLWLFYDTLVHRCKKLW